MERNEQELFINRDKMFAVEKATSVSKVFKQTRYLILVKESLLLVEN